MIPVSYTLIVVDMQPKFKAANGERVRKGCMREIMKAITSKAPIIFLEYDSDYIPGGYGPTLKELTKPVVDNYYIEYKTRDDGSYNVQKLVKKHKLPETFRVCGINTDCCVYETVRGLSLIFDNPNIDVVEDACASDWNHMLGIDSIKQISNKINVINV